MAILSSPDNSQSRRRAVGCGFAETKTAARGGRES